MAQDPFLDEIVPAGQPWPAVVQEGHYLTIIDPWEKIRSTI